MAKAATIWLRLGLAVLSAVLVFPPMFLTPASSAAEPVVAYPNYKIAVIMVTFSDNPAKPTIDGTKNELTKAYVNGALFTNANSMAAFYASASRGRVSITGEVFDNAGQWYTITRPLLNAEGCDWTEFFRETIRAANADIDFSQFNQVMLISPRHGCSTGGITASEVVPDTNGATYSVIDVSGSFGRIPDHELGHTMHLGHANSWECKAPGILVGKACAEYEYADRFNVMGVSPRMLQPTGWHKEYLGWLAPEEITTASTDGDYVLQTYESSNLLPKVLKIPQAWDAAGVVTNWYYLEYRQPVGFDNIVRTPTIQELGVPNGVLVHVIPAYNPRVTTTLLDMTPGSLPGRDIFDPALPLGYSYTDAQAKVSFGVVARTATSMTIRVKFGAASLCVPKAPTVTVKSVKGFGKPGQELRYELTVKNNSVLCGKQSLEVLTRKAPAGWKVTIDKKSKNAVSVLSGQTQKFTVRLTSPKKAKYQKYAFTLEARLAKKPANKKAIVLKPAIR